MNIDTSADFVQVAERLLAEKISLCGDWMLSRAELEEAVQPLVDKMLGMTYEEVCAWVHGSYSVYKNVQIRRLQAAPLCILMYKAQHEMKGATKH